MTETFEVKNNIAPEIIKEVFTPKTSPSGFRNNNSFKRSRVNSVWRSTESVSSLDPKILDLIPNKRI